MSSVDFSKFEDLIGQDVKLSGWIVKLHLTKAIVFVTITDGSGYKIQCVVDRSKFPDGARGASVMVVGKVVKSSGKQQSIEVQVESIVIIGKCDSAKYPLASQDVTLEYLRRHLHLRVRDEKIASIMRVRSMLAIATHIFFDSQGYFLVHTPLITTSDCEGAGEMFQLTTIMGKVDAAGKQLQSDHDFFKKSAYLTVSGQLNGEMYACGLGKIYTFGPTFRAEDSHTSRHLAEFWMIEPEVAFCDLPGIMDIAEKYVKFCIGSIMGSVDIDKKRVEFLTLITSQAFARCSYTDAIKLLQESKIIFENDKKVSVPVEWGIDLTTPMERWLAEVHFKRPVFVHDYPKEIKSFYMKLNDDGRTVANFDMLVPGVGELIGGSQREDSYEKLVKRMGELGMPLEPYKEYLELREFGSVPHSGFGLGFERLVMLCTGTEHIRDCIPFPRYPGHAEC